MNQVVAQPNFSTPEIDRALNELQYELEATAKVQAEHDGQQGIALTESLYSVRVLQGIIASKVQNCINIIREKLLVASAVMGAKEFEAETLKRMDKQRIEISNRSIDIINAHRSRQPYLKPGKAKQKRLVNIFGLVIAGIDSVLAYGSLRTSGLSTMQSAGLATAIFGLVFFATNLVTPWIKNSKSNVIGNIKALGVCAVVFAVFLGISRLRAEGLNAEVNIDPSSLNVAGPSTAYSPWPILMTTYGLFLCMFIIHQYYWQSDEEKSKQDEHNIHKQNIKKLEGEIELLKTGIKNAESEIQERKDRVRELWDRYHKLLQKAINSDRSAQAVYKRTYSLYNPNVPGFFNVEQIISYDTEIKFFDPKNQ